MIFNRPQLVAPELMFEAVAFARSHLGLVLADDPAPVKAAAKVAMGPDDDGAGVDPDDDCNGVAIIGIYGPLVPRRGNVQMCSRMTSYESLGAQLDEAVADPAISRIVLDIDSPGGAATGAFELADRIRAANAIKPVSAIVNFHAFSGGYLLASAAGEVSVSQSSGVGSIGVIAQHLDVSKMNEAMGVKVTAVYRGAKKNDLSPNEPLSDSSMATLNAMVESTYDQFTDYVAKHRGLPLHAVKGTEAGLYFGQQAIDAGLADRLETPQQAINRIASEVMATKAAKLTPAPAFGMTASGQKLRMKASAMDVKNSL
jgi:signal peptide peptidase SppA